MFRNRCSLTLSCFLQVEEFLHKHDGVAVDDTAKVLQNIIHGASEGIREDYECSVERWNEVVTALKVATLKVAAFIGHRKADTRRVKKRRYKAGSEPKPEPEVSGTLPPPLAEEPVYLKTTDDAKVTFPPVPRPYSLPSSNKLLWHVRITQMAEAVFEYLRTNERELRLLPVKVLKQIAKDDFLAPWALQTIGTVIMHVPTEDDIESLAEDPRVKVNVMQYDHTEAHVNDGQHIKDASLPGSQTRTGSLTHKTRDGNPFNAVNDVRQVERVSSLGRSSMDKLTSRSFFSP
jgi:hypothetical protein